MSAFKPKGMWESTRKLEREAYQQGKNARCEELAALRKLEKVVRAWRLSQTPTLAALLAELDELRR